MDARLKSRPDPKRSLPAHARIFVLGIGVVLVVMLAGTGATPGLVGAGAQVDVEIVHVASDVRVIAESRHHVLLRGRAVLATGGDYAVDISVVHGPARIL